MSTKNRFLETSLSHSKRAKFDGEGQLKDLPFGSFFRLLKKDGSTSKKTYIKNKGCYDRSIKKYVVTDCDDAYGYGKELKGSTKVTTKFIY